MIESLLVLIGYTKISLVSCEYIIYMYFIPLLLVTVKLPVKYVYILPFPGFAIPIYANTQFLFSSLLAKKYFSISSAIC